MELAFAHAGLDWREPVEIDPRYFRPAEVDALCADASKARMRLGWEPAVTFSLERKDRITLAVYHGSR